MFTVTQRLYRTEGDRIVPDGHKDARWLYAVPGTRIDDDEADRYGLADLESPKSKTKSNTKSKTKTKAKGKGAKSDAKSTPTPTPPASGADVLACDVDGCDFTTTARIALIGHSQKHRAG